MIKKQLYVCGFMFSPCKTKVALIHKLKPEWMKGCLNGVGGKVEAYDKSIHAAMIREFREETGVSTEVTEWKSFVQMDAPMGEIHFFLCFSDKISHVKTMEKEQVVVVAVDSLQNLATLTNLQWLVPMALDPEHMFTNTQAA